MKCKNCGHSLAECSNKIIRNKRIVWQEKYFVHLHGWGSNYNKLCNCGCGLPEPKLKEVKK